MNLIHRVKISKNNSYNQEKILHITSKKLIAIPNILYMRVHIHSWEITMKLSTMSQDSAIKPKPNLLDQIFSKIWLQANTPIKVGVWVKVKKSSWSQSWIELSMAIQSLKMLYLNCPLNTNLKENCLPSTKPQKDLSKKLWISISTMIARPLKTFKKCSNWLSSVNMNLLIEKM